MGGSQSQEDRSQTFSTIGLPPASIYGRPERSHSLRAPNDEQDIPRVRVGNRERSYRSTATRSSEMDDSDDWLRIDPPSARIAHSSLPPTRSHAPHPPRPPPPRAPPVDIDDSPRVRSSRRPLPPTGRSLRDLDEHEIVDLEQLLSTLHRLQLSAHQNRNGSQDESGTRTEHGERRRRHVPSSGSSRHRPRMRHAHSAGSPFLFLRPMPKAKCPLCSKEFTQPELDEHLPICSSKPRVQFNEDKLIQDAGECSICLEDMVTGDKIARLPCLCVYHIHCLKGWYKKSQTCPEHPDMKGV